MARMHARRKGKSGSTHMIERTDHPSWSSLKPREIESRILELSKSGKNPAQIGGMLRDQYAVPDIKTATGKKQARITIKSFGSRPKPNQITSRGISTTIGTVWETTSSG